MENFVKTLFRKRQRFILGGALGTAEAIASEWGRWRSFCWETGLFLHVSVWAAAPATLLPRLEGKYGNGPDGRKAKTAASRLGRPCRRAVGTSGYPAISRVVATAITLGGAGAIFLDCG